MDIEYQGHSRRSKKAIELWLNVAKDYNDGMAPEEIANKYVNPKTGKNYTREHIYWILARVRKGL